MPNERYKNAAEAPTVSNATRNRARTALSGFFRWMRDTKLRPRGWTPLDSVRFFREERPPDGIVVWEDNELPALLKAADELSCGIAIWIAVMGGLRRGEIARLEWTNITPTTINVEKSKTGRKRQVPLSSQLKERLEKEKRHGLRVVDWPEEYNGWSPASRRLLELHLAKKLPDLKEKCPAKFGWNVFRHTFASRLAQRGLSLNIIAEYLGDSPEVCREHYARFVPAHKRDRRVDGVNIRTTRKKRR